MGAPTGRRPLILVTNDDGIDSAGLRSLATALSALGDVLVSAPKHQHSAVGRALGPMGSVEPAPWTDAQHGIQAYSVDTTPAMATRVGIRLLANRPIDLAVAGINYGENLGTGISSSGTLGAAIEACSFGIPSLAVSLEVDDAHHFVVSDAVDFRYSAHFARRLAESVIAKGLPSGVDLVKVDLPLDATDSTPVRVTHLSRQRYFESVIAEQPDGSRQFVGYERVIDWDTLEPDSDIHALLVDRAISVCSLNINLSANVTTTQLNWLFESVH